MSDYVSDWKDPIEIARLKDVISMLKAENESLRAVLIGNAVTVPVIAIRETFPAWRLPVWIHLSTPPWARESSHER